MTPQTLKEIIGVQVEKFKVSFDEYYFDEDINGEGAFATREKILNFLYQSIEEAVREAFEATRVEKMEQEAFPKYKSYSMGQVDGHNNAVTEQREKQDNFLKKV